MGEKRSPSSSASTDDLVGVGVLQDVGEQVLGLVDAAQDALAAAEDLHHHDGVEALALEDPRGAGEVDVGRLAGEDLVRRAVGLEPHRPILAGRRRGERGGRAAGGLSAARPARPAGPRSASKSPAWRLAAPAPVRGSGRRPRPSRAVSSRSRSQIASTRATARPSSSRSSRSTRDLHGQHRPVVVGEGELHERELVVPAQQLPVRDAERVGDRRREVDPDDDRRRRVQDDGHAARRSGAARRAGGPTRRSLSRSRRSSGPEVQLGQPALDAAGDGVAGVTRRRCDARVAVAAGRRPPTAASAAPPCAARLGGHRAASRSPRTPRLGR